MASFVEVFNSAARIVTNPTSASPIMRAAAVTAVREGLRTVFSRASRPVIVVSRSIGQPTTAAIGRTSCGLTIAVPRKRSTAPSPIVVSRLPVEPKEPRTPRARMSTPSDHQADCHVWREPGEAAARQLRSLAERRDGRHAGRADRRP